MADLWRIRMVKGTANSSGGEREIVESREAMERMLLNAACEAAEDHRQNKDGDERRRFRAWRVLVRRLPEPEGWTVQRIVGVDHLVDGEWVECKWSLRAPELAVEEAS